MDNDTCEPINSSTGAHYQRCWQAFKTTAVHLVDAVIYKTEITLAVGFSDQYNQMHKRLQFGNCHQPAYIPYNCLTARHANKCTYTELVSCSNMFT